MFDLFADAEFWKTFVPQLLAGLVAAAVGVLGVLIGFALQRRSARSDSLDDAVERLLICLSEYADEMDLFVREYAGLFMRQSITEARPPGPRKPAGYSVSIAIEVVIVRARGQDRRMAMRIAEAWAEVRKSASSKRSTDAAGTLAVVITDWRTGNLRNEADRLQEVRAFALNPDV